ncbi:(d)CMP kinase [Gordonia sp. PP30]|uniref:uridine kinase family protein n=2 Tax=unclassified Gordonia (in: high G+C Gram-positive bacteria) TaxID=2657482 RepID=UPI001FFEE34F|nr:(d)CMP kinase [Gordonia sp. PP30]UQE75338.1 (d)CMP kinase [Gordonia sp. PP30]
MSGVSKGSSVEDLAAAAHAIASRDLRSGIIAVDGPSGAGKSTFADALAARLSALGRRALLIRTDYYATWDDPAGWWPELERDVLAPFRRSHDISHHPRIWIDGVPHAGPAELVHWAPLLIIEGVTAARQAIADRLTHAFWLDGPPAEERLARTVARDGEDQRPNLAAWQHFEDGWFAVDGTRRRCEVVPV